MYIEFVILDNFLLTYLAGAAATRLCHNKVRAWRYIIASAVGTAVAVFYPFMRVGVFLTVAVKLSLWCVLSVIMFFKTPRFLPASILFFGCTFAFGGACYAVLLCLCGNSNVYEFALRFPIFIVLLCGLTVYAAVRYCIKRLCVPRARAPYEYRTVVTVFGATMKFSAFLDTGNCVFDAYSGLPVIITDMDRFADKLDGAAAVKFAKELNKLRKITAKTPAGETEMYLVEPNEITVYSDRLGHKIYAMIGLIGGQTKSFSDRHEMLLCPAAMTEGL